VIATLGPPFQPQRQGGLEAELGAVDGLEAHRPADRDVIG
jgi:hypothetical protein